MYFQFKGNQADNKMSRQKHTHREQTDKKKGKRKKEQKHGDSFSSRTIINVWCLQSSMRSILHCPNKSSPFLWPPGEGSSFKSSQSSLFFPSFGITEIIASFHEEGVLPSVRVRLKEFRSSGVNSSLNVLYHSLGNLSLPGVLFDFSLKKSS